MSTSVTKANPQLPAAIAKLVALATPEMLSEMSGGITAGFPILGYKGKVWRVRQGGEEKMHLDADGNSMPTVDIVLVQANPHPSKNFYDKAYVEGSNEPPRCFSNDGVKPDASVQSPINALCASCPNNVWGSKITDNGKKGRACSDVRRMAIVFADDLYENGVNCQKFLLRVPPASLNPLKDYAEKVLAPKGIPFCAVVTRVGFDPQAAHPQFTFRPARFLNDEEAEAIVALRGSPDVQRILAEAVEFSAGGAAAEGASPTATAAPASPLAPAASTPPAGKPAKMRPASEEEAGADALTPPPPAPAKPAAKAPPAAANGDFMAAPPPKKAKKSAAAPPPAAATEEEEEPTPRAAAPAAAVPADFDNMLDAILNG